MKSLLITLLVAVCGAFANEAAFENVVPVTSNKNILQHNPISSIKYTADPGVLVYDDTVYVYGTNDGIVENLGENPVPNEYNLIDTLNIMASKDLVNWIDYGTIQVAGQNGPASWAESSWAPSVVYKTVDGVDKFYLYFANSGYGIGVLTADSPVGPFEDPIGGPLISYETPNCQEVVWLFDPSVLVDDDGTAYIYFGGGLEEDKPANPQTYRVAQLGEDMISLASEPVVIDAPWGFEDSGINKIGNTYYYTYSTNWSEGPYGDARIGLMTSDSPLGPFTFEDTIFNNPGDYFTVYGTNHHAIVQFKNHYYIFYHSEWLNYQNYDEPLGYRTAHVDEIPFVDGKFLNATGTFEGVEQLGFVDAFDENPATLMAWQGGVSTNNNKLLGRTTLTYGKGEWIGVSGVNFGGGATTITVSATSVNGAVIKITSGSLDGNVIGYITVPPTINRDYFVDITEEITKVSEVQDIFFIASDDVTVAYWTFGNIDD